VLGSLEVTNQVAERSVLRCTHHWVHASRPWREQQGEHHTMPISFMTEDTMVS